MNVESAVTLPKLTGDARADRWHDHRVAVRAELIEATVRAIEIHGPDLSLDDVLKTAGVSRPKLYRFFADKVALFVAVATYIQELVVERVVSNFDVTGSLRDVVGSMLGAYVDLVAERPNLFRFLISSHFGDGAQAQLLEEGRSRSDGTIEAIAAILTASGGDGTNLIYVGDAFVGGVGLGVLRWLNDPAISKEALVDELTVFLWGALTATLQRRGVKLDDTGRIVVGAAP